MSERSLIDQCSPTLAGIKTASLFSSICETEDLRRINRLLSSKGLVAIPLKKNKCSTLIYVFRPMLLKRALREEDTRNFLIGCGYEPDDIRLCIRHLIERLKETDFPHEIGVFLGYPLEDVKGFIENRGQNYKLLGMWKVYGDPKESAMLFEKYRNCTRSYMRAYENGNTIEQLTVAV